MAKTKTKDSTSSQRRKEKLAQDGAYIEIPDVSDIPGQENITNAGIPEAMSDTTAASDDEEGIRKGKDILVEDDDTEIVMGTEADVDDIMNYEANIPMFTLIYFQTTHYYIMGFIHLLFDIGHINIHDVGHDECHDEHLHLSAMYKITS